MSPPYSSGTTSGSGNDSSGNDVDSGKTANIVVVGAGFWAQGWHLPHLDRNDRVKITAIVDTNQHPRSHFNPHLEPLSTLADRYQCPVYASLRALLDDPIIKTVDGAIVCTPHSTHYEMGAELIRERARRYDEAKAKNSNNHAAEAEEGGERGYGHRPMNVLMEKPMTTNVREASELHDLANCVGGDRGLGCFLLNHSANYRPQARAARALVRSGKIGKVRHVSASFASPLSWIFDDPFNVGWNEPDGSGEMLGNGFAWGQSSHLLAWIYHVAGCDELVPSRVYCAMTTSDKTGADVSDAATVTCSNGATLSLSGTSLIPGNAHSDPPVGKRVMIQMFGTKGALFYSGNDRDPTSGKLEWLRGCGDVDGGGDIGAVEVQCPELGFQFEDLDQGGIGPESLQCFIDACLGREGYYVGADSAVGLRSVQTIDAMYRSHVSGNCENVRYSTDK